MTPINIQVSRSKVKVKGQGQRSSLFSISWGRGALVFHKQLYLQFRLMLIILGESAMVGRLKTSLEAELSRLMVAQCIEELRGNGDCSV